MACCIKRVVVCDCRLKMHEIAIRCCIVITICVHMCLRVDVCHYGCLRVMELLLILVVDVALALAKIV